MKENINVLASRSQRLVGRKSNKTKVIGNSNVCPVVNHAKTRTTGGKRSLSELSPGKNIATKKRSVFVDITNTKQLQPDKLNHGKRKENKKTEIKGLNKVKVRRSSTVTTRNRSKVLTTKPEIKEEKVKEELLLPESVVSLGCIELNSCKVEENVLKTITDNKSSVQKVRPVPEIPSSILQAVEDLKSPIIPLSDGLRPYDTVKDPFLVSEYAEDVFDNMKKRELQFPMTNYLTKDDTETTGPMRAILVDWLVEVQENFELYHETLYLAVKLVDCYLQDNPTPKEQLQLIGATGLLIACKIEEPHPPPLDDFQYICDDAYTRKMFINTEMKIFKALDFDINIPIAYRFLRRFARVTSMSMQILTLSRYILELSLHEAQFVDVKVSQMAAACLCLALKMKEEAEWDTNLVYHTGYQENDLTDIVINLNKMVQNACESKLVTVRTKYLHPLFLEVAKIPSVDPLFL